MSYKNDVYIAIGADDYYALEDFAMSKNDIILQRILTGADMFRECKYYGDDIVIIGWENADWWDDDNHSVKYLKAKISNLKKYNIAIFGEDYDDNTFVTNGEGFKPLNVVRTISFDGEDNE